MKNRRPIEFDRGRRLSGVFSDRMLEFFVEKNYIVGKEKIQTSGNRSAIRPSSIDLTLGDQLHEIVGSVTPKKGQPVRTIIEDKTKCVKTIPIGKETAVLRKGYVYLSELNESLNLPRLGDIDDLSYFDDELIPYYYMLHCNFSGRTSAKSTTGRLGILARVIVDGEPTYDMIPCRYRGKLYLEICPLAFDIQIKRGDSLNQLRLYDWTRLLEGTQLRQMVEHKPLLLDKDGSPIFDPEHIADDHVFLSVDLERDVVVYKAIDLGVPIDVSAEKYYDPKMFWTPERSDKNGCILLEKSKFYIMQSKERLVVPISYAVEIAPTDEALAEARVHYAGFVHPGSGYSCDEKAVGTTLVLEVSPRDVPTIAWDEKLFAKLFFHEMFDPPEQPYYSNGSYINQGHQNSILSKVFKQWDMT